MANGSIPGPQIPPLRRSAVEEQPEEPFCSRRFSITAGYQCAVRDADSRLNPDGRSPYTLAAPLCQSVGAPA